MTKILPTKRPKRNRAVMDAAAAQSLQMQRAMERIAKVATGLGRKDEETQRQARTAITETVEIWLSWLSEADPEVVEDFYTELEVLASAGNRRRIAKHAFRPVGVDERVASELARIEAARLAEAEAAAAAAEAAAAEAEKGALAAKTKAD